MINYSPLSTTCTLTVGGDSTFSGIINLSNNKGVVWPGGSIRAEGNTLKLGGTTLIDLQQDTQIQGSLTTTGRLDVDSGVTGYPSTKIQTGGFGDSQSGINILNSSTGYGYILFGDGSGAALYRGQIAYKHGDDFMAFNTAGLQRMMIDSSGRLLINATSTAFSDKLYLQADAYTTGGWRVGTAATYVGKLINDGGKLTLMSDGSRDVQIGNNGNPSMLYVDTSSASVGIGTISPDGVLHIKKDNATATFEIQGGLNTITAVDQIHAEINFGANDASVTGGIAGSIKSVTETDNGAHAGLAFYTGQQSRTPYLQRAMQIKNTGAISFGSGPDAYGTSGQVLQSNGGLASPTWVAAGTPGSGIYLPLAGGTMTGVLKLNDGVVLQIGSSADLQLYHEIDNSFIDNFIGDLTIRNFANDKDIIFESDNGSGGTTPYLQLDGSHTQTIAWKNIHFVDGVKALFGDYASPDLQIFHDGSHSYIKDTGTGSLYLQTNGAAIYLQDTSGNAMAQFTDGGGSFLMYNGDLKLSTTDTGVSVTGNGFFGLGGTGTTDGIISIDGGSGTGGEAYLRLMRGGTSGFILNHTASAIQVRATANIPMFFYTNDVLSLKINANNTISFPTYGAGYLKTDASGNITADSTIPGTGTFLSLAGGTMTGTNGITMPDDFPLKLGVNGSNDSQIFWDGDNLEIQARAASSDIVFRAANSSGTLLEFLTIDGGVGKTRAYRDIHFQDNVKASFGDTTTPDLQIYHDGTKSIIKDAGAGDLQINASSFVLNNSGDTKNMIIAIDGGAVNLFFDASKKLETTSAGVTITGKATVTDDIILSQVGPRIDFDNGSTGSFRLFSVSQNAAAMTITSAGAASFGSVVSATEFRPTNIVTNKIVKFNGSALDDSTMTDDGTNVSMLGNLTVGAAGGTAGKITGLLTAQITGDLDAANKKYVDDSITGGASYLGTWDPDVSLNSGFGNPSLSGGAADTGDYYVCSADGTATPNGATTEPNTWNTGDWVIWNEDLGTGGLWQKIDNTTVLSGNGTAGTIPVWTNDETIGDSTITTSSNNTTFAGNSTGQALVNQVNSNAGSSAYVTRKWTNDAGNAEIWRNSSTRTQTGGAAQSFNIYNTQDTNIWSGGTRAVNFDTSQNATFAGNVRIPVAWSNSNLESNAIYAKNSNDGFGFGVGTGISTWWAYSTENGLMRMIDNANDGSYITLRTNNTDRVTINNSAATFAGNIVASSTSSTIGTPRIIMQSDGTLDWGQVRDYGTLTWDTGYALVKGQSGKGVKIQVNNSTTVLTIDTNQMATFADQSTFTGQLNFDHNLFGSGYIAGTTTERVKKIKNTALESSTETNQAVVHPYFNNDLGNWVARGGTVTFGGLSTTPSLSAQNIMFEPTQDFLSIASGDITGSTWSITLTSTNSGQMNLNYGCWIGITFGSTSFDPDSMLIETNTNADGSGTWTTVLNSSVADTCYYTYQNVGGTGVRAIKFTMGQTSQGPRVCNIFAYNYAADGMKHFFLGKQGGSVFGNIIPGTDYINGGTYFPKLGASGSRWDQVWVDKISDINNSFGTSGQVLSSNASGQLDWISGSALPGGPYVTIGTAQTITGAKSFNTGVGDVGLAVYTSGESTTPNVRFGRDSGQYIGFSVRDRTNTIVFRQDEGTGEHLANLDLWTSTTGDKYFKINENDQSGNLISNWLTIKNSYVGIGTISPTFKLHVNSAENGVTAVGVSNSGSGASRVYLDASNGDFSGSDYMWIGQNNDLSGEIFMAQSAGSFHIKTQPGGTSTTQFTVTQAGNIGIGVTNPSDKLRVEGSIRTNSSGDGEVFFGTGSLNKIVLDGTDMELWSGSLAASITMSNQGLIKFGVYGLGGTGTPTALLGVDNSGNVVKTTTAGDLPGGPYLPLAGGGMTGTLVIGSQQLKFSDAGRLFMGDSNDLQIYHDGTHSFVKNTTGSLYVLDDSYVEIGNGAEVSAGFVVNGAVKLYYDNAQKFETSNTGITVTGNIDGAANMFLQDYIYHSGDGNTYFGFSANDEFLVVAGGSNKFAADANAAYMYYQGGLKLQTTSAGVSITGSLSTSEDISVSGDVMVTGTTTAGGTLICEGNITVQDSDKLQLGNSQDLELYHASGASYIDNDTGHLYIRNNVDNDDGSNIYIQAKSGENSIVCQDDGNVSIYDNNILRLNTTTSGIGAYGYIGFGSSGTSTGSSTGFKYGSTSPGTSQGICITTSDTGGAHFDGVAKFQNTNTNQGAGMFQMINYGALYSRYMQFFRGSTSNIIGYIGYNGSNTSVTFSTTNSDIRTKKNITSWDENVLDKFKALQPKRFHFKAAIGNKGLEKEKGFIAQYETKNFPEAYQLNGTDEKATYGFHPMEMVPYMMKAIKDLTIKNEELERRIKTLES